VIRIPEGMKCSDSILLKRREVLVESYAELHIGACVRGRRDNLG
jgi:hypothetical protein